jgi:hypothetical protein
LEFAVTKEEAKDYVMTHLPCTIKGVEAIFDTYFHGTVKLQKLVGLTPQPLGYSTLVFYLEFNMSGIVEEVALPHFKSLMRCFRAWAAYHSFKIEREGFGTEGNYVVWTKPHIEIKEDRVTNTKPANKM